MTREEEIEKVATHYAELVEWEYNIPASIKRIVKSAYRMGTKWSDEHQNLESLWHDVSEEPLLEETEIIFINERDFAHISKRKGGHFSYAYVYYSWEEYVNSLKIKKWAYISDLLPKGGEK